MALFKTQGKSRGKGKTVAMSPSCSWAKRKPCGVPTVNQMVAEGQRCRNKCTVATDPVTSPMDAA